MAASEPATLSTFSAASRDFMRMARSLCLCLHGTFWSNMSPARHGLVLALQIMFTFAVTTAMH
jgi:hypothetical protein